MKFLVDKMPHNRSECPFYKRGICNNDICMGGKLLEDGQKYFDCEYFDNGNDPKYCNWLKEVDHETY